MTDQLTIEDASPGTYRVRYSCPNGGGAIPAKPYGSRAEAIDEVRRGVERRWRHYPKDIAAMTYAAELVEDTP